MVPPSPTIGINLILTMGAAASEPGAAAKGHRVVLAVPRRLLLGFQGIGARKGDDGSDGRLWMYSQIRSIVFTIAPTPVPVCWCKTDEPSCYYCVDFPCLFAVSIGHADVGELFVAITLQHWTLNA